MHVSSHRVRRCAVAHRHILCAMFGHTAEDGKSCWLLQCDGALAICMLLLLSLLLLLFCIVLEHIALYNVTHYLLLMTHGCICITNAIMVAMAVLKHKPTCFQHALQRLLFCVTCYAL